MRSVREDEAGCPEGQVTGAGRGAAAPGGPRDVREDRWWAPGLGTRREAPRARRVAALADAPVDACAPGRGRRMSRETGMAEVNAARPGRSRGRMFDGQGWPRADARRTLGPCPERSEPALPSGARSRGLRGRDRNGIACFPRHVASAGASTHANRGRRAGPDGAGVMARLPCPARVGCGLFARTRVARGCEPFAARSCAMPPA